MEALEIKRTGSPGAVRKLGDKYYQFEVPLSGYPDGTWLDFFMEPSTFTTMFVPRMVEFTYQPATALFPSFEHQVKENLKLFDQWCATANKKCAELVARKKREEAQRQEREKAEREELDRLTEKLKGA